MWKKVILILAIAVFQLVAGSGIFARADVALASGSVLVLDMEMGILPGTEEFLREAIDEAISIKASAIVIQLDTPGGMLGTSQAMIKDVFDSPVPIFVYVGPSGSTATSAGVFITMAAHVAAMAPGTSIGAAHPVQSSGEDVKDDMRAKVENMTVAMIQSITEQRGRNVDWVKKAIIESDSITENDALEKKVIDVVASDLNDLLRQVKGKKIKLAGKEVILDDLSKLPRIPFEISFKQYVLNILSNPVLVGILWMVAMAGLGIEFYHPGGILPGVVGAICLVLALAAYQIIPMNVSGIVLICLGAALIGAEFFMPSGIFAIGGIASIVFGSIYLIDTSIEPFLEVNRLQLGIFAVIIGSLMLSMVYAVLRVHQKQKETGQEGMIGDFVEVVDTFSNQGKVFTNGEYWDAKIESGIAEKGSKLKVKAVDGLTLILETQTT